MASQQQQAPTAKLAKFEEHNAEFAKTWKCPLMMKDMRRSPAERVFVLTCMDPRVCPERFVGTDGWPLVLRNAGGRASPDMIRSITVLRALMDVAPSFTVMVIHHTDCGITHIKEADVHSNVKRRSGDMTTQLLKGINMDLGLCPADELDASVVADVKALQAEELLKGVDVFGYMFDTETGLIRQVDCS